MEGERQVTLRVIKTGSTAQSIPVEYFTTGNGSAVGERFSILSVSRMCYRIYVTIHTFSW